MVITVLSGWVIGVGHSAQWEGNWSLNRTETFPEQYDTFVGSAASLYHFSPTEVNRDHLVREGYPESVAGDDRIPVVGNSVVDAIEMKSETEDDESVFDVYLPWKRVTSGSGSISIDGRTCWRTGSVQ